MEYRPLDSANSEIRILNLDSNDQFDSEVTATLCHSSLNDLPDYVALSYRWGDPDDSRHIIVNGNSIAITANLSEALRHLRANALLRVWVDAICIDQNNVQEKGKQVYLMSYIYYRARQVIVWIGQSREGSAEEVQLDLLVSGDKSHRRVQLDLIIERDYWRRVWIIQEIAMAKQITIYCGSQHASWEDFCSALTESLTNISTREEIKQLLYQNIESTIQLRRDKSRSDGATPISLFSILTRSWMAQSTDPRDKVFGILGLATDSKTYIPLPSYAETPETICRKITIGHVIKTDELDIVPLLGRGCDDASRSKSSWVADWTALDGKRLQRQINYLGKISEEHSITVLRKFNDQYRASGNEKAVVSHKNGVLTCEALYVGKVAQTSGSISENATADRFRSQKARPLPNPYKTREATFQAILCTLMGVYNPDYGNEWLSTILYILRSRSTIFEFDEETKRWIDLHRSFMFHGQTLEEWARWKNSTGEGRISRLSNLFNREFALQFYEQEGFIPYLALQIRQGVRFLMTSTGLLGWARERGRVGDKIYILKGCSVPVLLREREEGGFIVVGDTWIYGMMAGEAIEHAPASAWHDIELY